MLLRILDSKGISDLVPSRVLLALLVARQRCRLLALQAVQARTIVKQKNTGQSERVTTVQQGSAGQPEADTAAGRREKDRARHGVT